MKGCGRRLIPDIIPARAEGEGFEEHHINLSERPAGTRFKPRTFQTWRDGLNETNRWEMSCRLAAKEPGNKGTFGTHTHTHTHTHVPFLRTHTVKEDEGEQRWGGAL